MLKQNKWEMLKFEAIKNHARLFKTMLLSHSSYLVAHSNFVSVYDLFLNKWTQNIEFESNIFTIFIQQEQGNDQSRKIAVLLEDGSKKFIKLNDAVEATEWVICRNYTA